MFAAATGIESQNIVGYAQTKLQNGATLLAPQFLNSTGTAFSLDDFTPTGNDVYGRVSINLLNEYGVVKTTYTWTDEGGENWNVSDVWVDDDNNVVSDTGVTFDPGQGLYVTGANASQSLRSSGQVGLSDVALQLCNGATLFGNPFPVSVSLNDFTPKGDNVYGRVAINLLDYAGRVETTYTWTDEGGKDWDVADVWVDDDNNIIEGDAVTFDPGQGLWVNGGSEAQYLELAAPEL